MAMIDKRSVEIVAKNKGLYLEPWANNDPKVPDKELYWLVDEDTTLPANLDPSPIEQIDEMLKELPDKDASNPRPEPQYGDGTEA